MLHTYKPPRTVWITGSSRGIGASIAREFAFHGDHVVIHYYQNEQAARVLYDELQPNAMLVQGDIRLPNDVRKMYHRIADTFGSVDILINNAGIAQQKLFTDITENEWDDMMNVHVKGAFLCTQTVLPTMIHAKSGSIVNISSIWGISGASCEVHYSTAKAALIGMTKALAQEVAPCSISVNCVAPGVIDTDMMQTFNEDERNLICQDIPLGRFGTPSEIAKLIYFLCSDDAKYITGQVISPNGGMII